MADLIAIGKGFDQRWCMEIPEGETIRLGRAPRTGWSVIWDNQVSREHADIRLADGCLHVTCLGTAKNPIFLNGDSIREFSVQTGQEFQIGETIFQFVDDSKSSTSVVDEQAFDEDELSSLQSLAQNSWQTVFGRLPDLIAESNTNEDLASLILEQMLFAIPHAEAVAVMHFDIAKDPTLRKPEMMLTRVRDDTMTFRPSNRLIRATMENHKNVLHMWNEMGSNDAEYTMVGNLDWAFCAPVNDRSCAGWCLYAAGSTSDGTASRRRLLGDLRSTQVLAQFVGSISQVRLLEHQASKMAQYFSPTIVNTLKRDKAQLEPREQDVPVLFCDLRGFSWRVDRDQHHLRAIFDRVNVALGVMTRSIHKFEGAISDFQGDAALAFWGWPYLLEDGPLPACRAALSMLKEFNEAYDGDDSTSDGFQVGIGIGHGPAIAGRMGAAEQVKVGVFGHVVNTTSRLEGMTKQFRVPIIMNDAATEFVRQHMSTDEARCRKLAMVRPLGVNTATMISELLPAADTPGTVSDADIAQHEEAVDAFIDGDWTKASDMFEGLAAGDRAKDYLLWYMASQNFEVPADWDGVLNLTSK